MYINTYIHCLFIINLEYGPFLLFPEKKKKKNKRIISSFFYSKI